jgi:hypothetical protein
MGMPTSNLFHHHTTVSPYGYAVFVKEVRIFLDSRPKGRPQTPLYSPDPTLDL